MSNLVNLPIPAAVLTQALELQNQIADLLKPYLVPLTPEDRHTIPKMSDKTVAFVNKALSFAISNPKFAPQDLDVKSLQEDVQRVSDLHQMETPVLVLESLLHDTIIAAGSDAYLTALAYLPLCKTPQSAMCPAHRLFTMN